MPTRSKKSYQDVTKKRGHNKKASFDTDSGKDIENNINVSNTSNRELRTRKRKLKRSIEKATESNWVVSDLSNNVKQTHSNIDTTMDCSMMSNTDRGFEPDPETDLTTSARNLRSRKVSVVEKSVKVKKNRVKRRDTEVSTSINNLETDSEVNFFCEHSPKNAANTKQPKKKKKVKNSDKKKQKTKSTLDETKMSLNTTLENDKDFEDINLNTSKGSITRYNTEEATNYPSKHVLQQRQSTLEEKILVKQHEDESNNMKNNLDEYLSQNSPNSLNDYLIKRTSDIKNSTFEKQHDINTTYEKEKRNNSVIIVNTSTDEDRNKLTGSSRSLTRRGTHEDNITFEIKNEDEATVPEEDIGENSSDESNAAVANKTIKNTKIEENLFSNASLNFKKSTIFHAENTTLEEQSKAVDTTYEIDRSIDNIGRIASENLNMSNSPNKQMPGRKSSINTFDKKDINTTHDKNGGASVISSVKDRKHKSKINVSYDLNDKSDKIDKETSTSFDAFKKGAMTRKSNVRDTTFEENTLPALDLTKENLEMENVLSSSNTKRKSFHRQSKNMSHLASIESELKFHNLSEAIDQKFNITFDKDTERNSKSSLISSDNSVSSKYEISQISITSDENEDNIDDTTPILIESSINESTNKEDTTNTFLKVETPMKREGTFTKDGPEVQIESPQSLNKSSSVMPTAGCTPYYTSKTSQKKTMLNVTRSIEKRMSGVAAPRMTRVMFCSPVDNPAAVEQAKRKIIKSNLKGSSKSFVFDEDAAMSRPPRKRSYTHSEVDDISAKRSRLTEDLQNSVNRLSRPRTTSATGNLSTPRKPTTPSKSKSESKPVRTKLPNFGALHQKQFAKMESLDEFQERKAKRARHMLTVSGSASMLERISPKNNTESQKSVTKDSTKSIDKTETPTKKLPTLESLRPGYTKFGFKLNMNINPFSVPPKIEKTLEKSNETQRKLLPSLTGTVGIKKTALRREAAKSAIMREKSNLEKRSINRNENRTFIKGVRTNRRFELQMKLRNIN